MRSFLCCSAFLFLFLNRWSIISEKLWQNYENFQEILDSHLPCGIQRPVKTKQIYSFTSGIETIQTHGIIVSVTLYGFVVSLYVLIYVGITFFYCSQGKWVIHFIFFLAQCLSFSNKNMFYCWTWYYLKVDKKNVTRTLYIFGKCTYPQNTIPISAWGFNHSE